MPVTRSRSSKSTVPSLSFLHWFSPHSVVPAGASWNSEMVLCVRFQNRVGRSAENVLATEAMSAGMTSRGLCMVSSPLLWRLANGSRERKSRDRRRRAGGHLIPWLNDRRETRQRNKGIDTTAVGGLTISSELCGRLSGRSATDEVLWDGNAHLES